MENLNLPPFYVGQKVVKMKDGSVIKKGDIVTVTHQFRCGCGEWYIQWGQPIQQYGIITCTCTKCKSNMREIVPIKADWVAQARNFAPLQEQTYPLISLKKVVEENRELVSAN